MPTLVLLRHGQSTWNAENRFTGWEDVPLSEKGVAEAREAGRLLASEGPIPDVVHTSLQRRAIETANLALEEMDRLWLPVHRSWRLNERHYGALQGLDKKETAEKLGADKMLEFRRGYATPPPPVEPDDPRHPRNDARYADVPEDLLPASECLKDVLERMLPYWDGPISDDLRAGRIPLVAAHGNSLRALVKHLDGISDDEITELNIPTGIPLVYELDDSLSAVSSRYLGDPEAAAAAAAAVANQSR